MAISKADFARYLRAFSNGEYEIYSSFYTDDVELTLGTVGVIQGKQGILDFYKAMNRSVMETLTINQVVVDDEGIAADVDMKFTAVADAPDFVVAPMKKGEIIESGVYAFYKLRDGKICSIRTVRSKPQKGPYLP
jgi:ketosteroid isomerase-like protein